MTRRSVLQRRITNIFNEIRMEEIRIAEGINGEPEHQVVVLRYIFFSSAIELTKSSCKVSAMIVRIMSHCLHPNREVHQGDNEYSKK